MAEANGAVSEANGIKGSETVAMEGQAADAAQAAVAADGQTAGANGDQPATRIALIGIIVQNEQSVERLNEILHDNRAIIEGRMGVPCRSKGLAVMSVVVEGLPDQISSLAGKIGMLKGVSSKTVYAKNAE